jgi:hypothetical protein
MNIRSSHKCHNDEFYRFIGGTLQMTATATYSDGTTADVTGEASWLTTDVHVGTVSRTGVLIGTGPGTVDVLASFDEQVGSIGLPVQ